jgi:diguanylate cyclase
MREVLSGPGATSSSGRNSFSATEERPSLRNGRFLMAAGTSLLVCVALFVCAFLELLPWRIALEGTAGIVTLAVMFYALFRSGLHLRFADPSLTTEQIGAAIVFLAYIMYHAEAARSAFTLFYPVALLFGVFRLTAARLMTLALLALVAHGVMLHLSYVDDPDMDVKAAVTEFSILMIVLPWFAVMGGYVSRLRSNLAQSHRRLQSAFERIEQIAIRDELTGLYNRRFLLETLARERARADRGGAVFSVCLLDLDDFKSINDTLGHAAGDAVLKQFAALAQPALRGIDVFGRFGGEEFLIILPGAGREGATACGERVRQALAATQFAALPTGRRVTVTVGIATHLPGEDVTGLLARADTALYQGKSAGRNRVVTMG